MRGINTLGRTWWREDKGMDWKGDGFGKLYFKGGTLYSVGFLDRWLMYLRNSDLCHSFSGQEGGALLRTSHCDCS